MLNHENIRLSYTLIAYVLIVIKSFFLNNVTLHVFTASIESVFLYFE